jgi:glycosyltransferase involved in cell wall biosynthesis
VKKRLKVLLLAYVVSPYRGSEYSVAWNFVSRMSRECEITVLYGASGEHMGDIDEMREYLEKQTLQNVEFIPVLPSRIGNALNYANRKGWLPYTFYLAYNLWHRQAYRVAHRLVETRQYDLIHYLGPIGYREPGYLWKLGLPYVWGPISGATNVPFSLLAALPLGGKCKFLFRSAANWVQLRFSMRLRHALSNVDVLLTATTENKSIFKSVLGKDSAYLPENAIEGNPELDMSKFPIVGKIVLIWIGRVDAGKALGLFIDSLHASGCASKFIVHIVGDGPLKAGLQWSAQSKGVDESFIWHGQVPRVKVLELLKKAHLNVITSVSEGNPTTIWEAMRCGVPTLTLDHCGMRDTVSKENGIKIPVKRYDLLVADLACEFKALVAEPQRLSQMASMVLRDAESYLWDRRVPFFLKKYDEAIARRKVSQRG